MTCLVLLPLKTSRSEQELKAEKEEVIKIGSTSRVRAKVIKLLGSTVAVT
jgi:hypothetical protein